MRSLLPALVVTATLLTAALPAAAPAATTTTTARPAPAAQQQGFFGRSRGYGSYRRSTRPAWPASRRPSYYRRGSRGRSFLHGLFWGWMLSHFFGGGFPLVFPFLLIVVILFALRPRRPRPMYR